VNVNSISWSHKNIAVKQYQSTRPACFVGPPAWPSPPAWFVPSASALVEVDFLQANIHQAILDVYECIIDTNLLNI
jgi:hypothetical protein